MTLSARNWAWDVGQRAARPSEGDAGDRVALKPGEKLVLLCIAEHENAEEGYAYPSYERIAQRTGLSVRSVQEHVKTLEFTGAFKIERRRRRDGQYYRHLYLLNVPDEYRSADPAWTGQQPY
ncbi:helix-turn-helix domain-containing protein [Curtobacterium sp. MCBA15_001]|uniref:helix-turn-helix domain-containing protein n=1 Tax=Curtobacterium sp. MCBA15_001 TaxID=1898731 RepID=UPI0008DE427E|nr:helix-turn-helix domain-containing protein [Curtobacterium sp. MCBA15_001]OIH95099.1 hypothetical protein BIU90_02880 [Curtobacterium sp. MCBA15_001]